VVEHLDGNTITVGLEEMVGEAERPKFVPDPQVMGPGGCRCPLCVIPIPISYRDVLILDQFMRPDGTVLPPDFTGCFLHQQLFRFDFMA
jgi:ribosomal protein S18